MLECPRGRRDLPCKHVYHIVGSNPTSSSISSQKQTMRTYLNIEDEQLRTLLELFVEIELSRNLTKREKYVRELVKKGLDKSRTEW